MQLIYAIYLQKIWAILFRLQRVTLYSYLSFIFSTPDTSPVSLPLGPPVKFWLVALPLSGVLHLHMESFTVH